LVLSLVQLDKRKDVFGFSALLRTKKDDFIYSFTAKDRKAALKHTLNTVPDLQEVGPLELVKDTKLSDELAHMEDRILIKAYRVGAVYAGLSIEENQMFGNNEPSEGFRTFMGWLGKHIKLKGYKGFKGGLDVEHNTTGTHSYVTDAHGFDIMFHVSTELPHSSFNPQQVERKRHIGNDVVVIIYQDGPTAKPFSPTSITSKFNHVYIVVQAVHSAGEEAAVGGAAKAPRRNSRATKGKRAIEVEEDATTGRSAVGGGSANGGKLQYRVAVVSKHGVHSHGPVLPDPNHLWDLDDVFRQFLLTKIVNAERAAYYAPGFGQARTRRLWLKSMLEKYGSAPKAGAAANSLDG
jgi:RAP1 GTPase activating protein 1